MNNFIGSLEWVYLLSATLTVGNECGLSEESGSNFEEFTPCLKIVNRSVIVT